MKRNIIEEIHYDSFDGPVSKYIKLLKELNSKNFSKVTIQTSENGVTIQRERLETDQEYNIRIKWPVPCREEFVKKAKTEPESLMQWITEENLLPQQIPDALETFRFSKYSDSLGEFLCSYMRHPNKYFRLGAIHGAISHNSHELIRKAIQDRALNDDNGYIRKWSQELIEK